MSHTTKITRYRGDTAPDRFILKDEAGNVLNIAGYSFRMSVNTEREPADVSTQLFTVAGVIDDAANGAFSFTPSAGDADQTPGAYWFDVEATDAGGKTKTVELGAYIIKQDISK